MEKTITSSITIETKPVMRVACYQAVSATPEDDASRFMEQWLSRHNPGEPSGHFGFDIDVSQEQAKAGLMGYEVWRTVPEGVEPSEGVTIKDFPGGLYATMTLYLPFEDPFARIPAGWNQLHEWVISSDKYRSGNHQWLEELLAGEGGDNLKLYHPIQPDYAAE